MTREAKIGLLTGLGVIVLIGVLLSEYLGPGAGASGSTVRVAALPMGASYRERMLQPAGVPGMAPGAGSDVSDSGQASVPVAYGQAVEAAQRGPAEADGATPPVVAGAVTPIAAGQVLGIPATGDGARVPVIQVGDGQAAGSGAAGGGVSSGAARVAGKEYVIVAGDTLAKIAGKCYKSGKPENVQRIVAANPGVLKNVNTMLVVGKKLVIPDAAVAEAPKVAAKGDGPAHAAPKLMVYAPGAKTGAVKDAKDSSGRLTAPKADAAKAADTKKDVPTVIYVVRHGDTLGTIAARQLGSGNKEEVAKMVAKIAALNKIKDGASVSAGMKLKLPAK